MFVYLLSKWLWGNSQENPDEVKPPSRAASEESFATSHSSPEEVKDRQKSISIDGDKIEESRYGTPHSTLATRHCLESREPSESSSLSCDSSISSVKPIDLMDNHHPVLFPAEMIPDGPMFPEVDEEILYFHRPSSLPHLNNGFNGFNDIQETRFLESYIPHHPLPEIQSSQSGSENEFIERLMPLTISADCNTRDRRVLLDHIETRPKSTLPEFPMNPPALFVEEQESSRDYVMGGYAPLHFGTLLADRYYVVRKLGFGHFSTVWLVFNKANQSYSALKISRATYDYAETSVEEVRFLRRIANFSGIAGSNRVVSLLDEFSYYSPLGTHHCAILEPLGRSLYQLIVQSGQVGASLPSIKKLAQQLLEGLRFLHEDVGIIHTDLKPENITIGATSDTFKQWAKIALTDYATSRKTKFAHANFPSNIKDQLEICNEIIYFDSIRRLEKSRPDLVKLLWEKEFNDEGPYEDFAKRERQLLIQEEEKKNGPPHEPETPASETDDDTSDIDSLIQNSETEFKIVDLGTAQYTEHLTSNQFQTLQYRSPEAVLRAHITPAIDIWSLACVLYEAATGDYLFNPVGNREALDQNRAARGQFQCFIAILGPPPSDLNKVFLNNRIYNSLFTPDGKFINEPNVGNVSIEKHIKRHITEPDVKTFIQFMERMLCYNPQRRATAKELLNFKWFGDSNGSN